MCLSLDENKESNIAVEDIVVYKRLVTVLILPEDHGKAFTGIIDDTPCEGVISIDKESTFFCTNSYDLDGQTAPEKFGYKYSWVMDNKVCDISIEGKPIIKDHKSINESGISLKTPYYDFPVVIGETYYSEIVVDDYNVEKAIHSFSTLEDAKLDGNGIYVKCIIPKGSTYYVGNFVGTKSLASNALTYLELV